MGSQSPSFLKMEEGEGRNVSLSRVGVRSIVSDRSWETVVDRKNLTTQDV